MSDISPEIVTNLNYHDKPKDCQVIYTVSFYYTKMKYTG